MIQQFEMDERTLEERREWVRSFEGLGTRRAILGTNQWAISVARALDIEYFIDDFTSEKVLLGKPIISMCEADSDVMTLSTALMRPLTARQALNASIKSSLDYYSFLRFTSIPALGIDFLIDRGIWELNSVARLSAVRDSLHDEESRETLDRVIRLRRDLDLEAMVVFSDRQVVQYFEPFIRLEAGQSFLDVGGFDGLTTQTAIEKFGADVACHIFEPNKRMWSSLHAKFSAMLNVEVHEFGLSAATGYVQFEANGSSSRAGSGAETICVKALDDLDFSSADLIKVDIEGGEEDFLIGASQTIARFQPQLAIACYHRNEQLVSIFEKVRSIMPDARVYLRHFTEGFPETDIFFVPPRFW